MIRSYRSSDIYELMGPAETQYGPPVQGACDDQQVQGADVPETRVIEMGQTSGTFDVSWDMYSVFPDRMIISYEGATLFDTGCVTGTGSATLTYAGSSSQITVEIIPNCDGAMAATLWNFTINCPQ